MQDIACRKSNEKDVATMMRTVSRSAPSSSIARQGEPYAPANCAAMASCSAASSSGMRGSPSFLLPDSTEERNRYEETRALLVMHGGCNTETSMAATGRER